MKKINKSTGITLIALIITVIVMIILVGVTVNVALNGGLFKTANEASRKTEKAMMEEELNVIIATMNANVLSNPEKFTIDANDSEGIYYLFENILKELENNFEVDNNIKTNINDGERDIECLDYEKMLSNGLAKVNEDGTITFTAPCKYKGNDINIKFELEQTEENIKLNSFSLEDINEVIISQTAETPTLTVGENIKSLTEEGVPIPKGFYYVTGTKDTGVVISDSQADENNATGNNGNQFVWVPVKINNKLNIKIDSNKTVENIRILDLNGYDETFNVNSSYFEKTIDINDNTIYEIIITYEDGTKETKMEYITNCYKTTTKPVTAKIMMILMNKQGITSEEKFYEYLKETYIKEHPEANIETNIEILIFTLSNDSDYSDTAIETENVLKYGGFYIARYEAGTNGTIKKGQSVKTNISFEDAKANCENMYKDSNLYGVKSALPSGAAWDAVCNWLLSTNEKTETQIYLSDKNGGYFKPNATTTRYPTISGSSESYKANNIYDLNGNAREWTMQTEGTKNISRGSSSNSVATGLSGNMYSLNSSTNTDSYSGYRPILYVL